MNVRRLIGFLIAIIFVLTTVVAFAAGQLGRNQGQKRRQQGDQGPGKNTQNNSRPIQDKRRSAESQKERMFSSPKSFSSVQP